MLKGSLWSCSSLADISVVCTAAARSPNFLRYRCAGSGSFMPRKSRKGRSYKEGRLERLLELAPDAMVVADEAGKIILINAQAETVFGYQREEVLGRDVEVLLPERFRERHRRHRMHFIVEPRVRRMGAKLELFGLRKAGTEFPAEISLSPIATEQGLLVTSAIRDVTERQLVDEARLRLAAIVESSEDAIISKTLDGIITSWNAAAQRIFGYTVEEAVGQPVAILLPPDVLPEENGILETLRTGKRIEHYETVRVTKAGKRVNVSLTISPIKDSRGKIVGASKIVRDITERKLAEEALRTSAERLRLAQWAAHVGTFDMNLRTGVDTWTPETEALYGLPPGGFGGTLADFEKLIHPDDRQRVIELARETIRSGRSTDGEWRVIWPDGSVHWIAGRGHVLRDETGEPSRLVGVNIDITERKRAEETLSGMTRKLIEAQEQERARIGRELHDDVAQRLAMLALELDQIHHPPADVKSVVRGVRKRLNEISSDVQALSRDLHSSKLEYLGVADGIKSWCKEFAARHKMRIDFQSNVSDTLTREVGVPLFRLLQEALHNIIKHSGVRQAKVQLRAESGEIHLIVSDSGKGFDVDAALAGEGLGLTSMRERVRLVNGTIVIESKPLGGTTIRVQVPFDAG